MDCYSHFLKSLLILSFVVQPSLTEAQDAQPQDFESLANQCYLSADAQKENRAQYDLRLDLYRASAEVKATINARKIENAFIAPEDLLTLIKNLRTIEPLLTDLKPLVSTKYFKKLAADPNFGIFSTTNLFLETIRQPAFVSEGNQRTEFHKLLDNPDYKKNIQNIQTYLSDEKVFKAMTDLGERSLTVFTPDGLESASEILTLFKDANLESKEPVVQSTLPYPRAQKGSFAEEIRSIVKNSILKDYLFEEKISDEEVADLRLHGGVAKDTWARIDKLLEIVKRRDPNITVAGVINQDKLPRRSAMDQYLVPQYMKNSLKPIQVMYKGEKKIITVHEAIAIDALARTLMGEAVMCDASTDQFYAITRVVLARSEKLEKVLKSNSEAQNRNLNIEKKNVQILLDKDATVNFTQERKEVSPLAVYGRLQDKTVWRSEDEHTLTAADLHPIAQIVSSPKQFNAWSERAETKPKSVASFRAKNQRSPESLPLEIKFSFYKPFSGNNMADLSYTLCPPAPETASHKAWVHALDIATAAVLDAEKFKKQYKWSPDEDVVFYSHGPDVEGMKVVPDIQLLKCGDGKNHECKPLRLSGGPGTCSKIRFFTP